MKKLAKFETAPDPSVGQGGLANLNSRFFKRGQSPVLLKTRYTPPEAARAIFWLFTPKTVLTTITTLGSGEH